MTFDGATHDPVQKAVRDALIAFMAATAQAQAEAPKSAQRAGIVHAKAKARDIAGASRATRAISSAPCRRCSARAPISLTYRSRRAQPSD
jgi:DNA invertase Pin-like site-specific DNA recombinase